MELQLLAATLLAPCAVQSCNASTGARQHLTHLGDWVLRRASHVQGAQASSGHSQALRHCFQDTAADVNCGRGRFHASVVTPHSKQADSQHARIGPQACRVTSSACHY